MIARLLAVMRVRLPSCWKAAEPFTTLAPSIFAPAPKQNGASPARASAAARDRRARERTLHTADCSIRFIADPVFLTLVVRLQPARNEVRQVVGPIQNVARFPYSFGHQLSAAIVPSQYWAVNTK